MTKRGPFLTNPSFPLAGKLPDSEKAKVKSYYKP